MWISDTIERGYDFVQQLSGKTQGTGLFGQEKEVSEPDNSTKVYFGYLALQFHKSWGKCVGRGRRQALGSGHDVRCVELPFLPWFSTSLPGTRKNMAKSTFSESLFAICVDILFASKQQSINQMFQHKKENLAGKCIYHICWAHIMLFGEFKGNLCFLVSDHLRYRFQNTKCMFRLNPCEP